MKVICKSNTGHRLWLPDAKVYVPAEFEEIEVEDRRARWLTDDVRVVVQGSKTAGTIHAPPGRTPPPPPSEPMAREPRTPTAPPVSKTRPKRRKRSED